MTVLDGRISRFVGAARKLLMVQAAVALLAAALAVWAFLAVRDLAAERDQLQSRVAQLEGQKAAATPPAAAPAVESPEANMAAPAPSVLMPMPVPIVITDPGPTQDIAPVDEGSPDVRTDVEPVGEQDCSGASANQPRCRPGRWTRRDPPAVRPVPPAAPAPERGGNREQPQLN